VRIGIFGGSFDPPHVGHLILASDAVEALALDRLLFVPAARQPLKDGSTANAAHRAAMVRLLAGDDPRFGVETVEIERGGLSFTVDTLRQLRGLFPGASLLLVLGTDAAALLPQWREAEAVVSMAQLVVLSRDGHSVGMLPEAVALMAARGAGTPIPLATRRLDISSTEIRERLAAGRSVRGFVPEAVAAYIAAHGLYATDRSGDRGSHDDGSIGT
jgi:nicotinate-nucleotide adenylyltransferase